MAKLLAQACLLAGMVLTSVSGLQTARVAAQSPPTAPRRDIVFVRGIDSAGTCDQAEEWVEHYFASPLGKALFSFLDIGAYLHFNYRDGGSYSCPRSEPAYTALDTCDGIMKAAGELKELVDSSTDSKVTIVAHSMGGLVSAYLVANDEAWARDHVASVVAFDSPLKGLTPQMQLGQPLISVCGRDISVYDDSVTQMSEDSIIVGTAARAGGVVPFYALDSTRDDVPLLGIEFVPRDLMTLDGLRAFQLQAACDRPGADIGKCEPPVSVDDDHETVWSCRFDSSADGSCPSEGLDKAFLVGCAAAASVDCSLLHTEVFPGESRLQSVGVTQESEQLRFSLSYDGSIRIRITSPDGTLYGPDRQIASGSYSSGAGYQLYEIPEPLTGTWTIELTGEDLPQEGAAVAIAVVATDETAVAQQEGAANPATGRDGFGTTGGKLLSVLAGMAAVGAALLVGVLWWTRHRRGRST